MHSIRRSALVEQPAGRMFDLVNDVNAYPRRFNWCSRAEIVEDRPDCLLARLDLGWGSFRTWFMTENHLQRPHCIDMRLRDGPFRHLHGRWVFQPLTDSACKVSLELEFKPASVLLGKMLVLGLQGLADRMVNDFVRVAGEAA